MSREETLRLLSLWPKPSPRSPGISGEFVGLFQGRARLRSFPASRKLVGSMLSIIAKIKHRTLHISSLGFHKKFTIGKVLYFYQVQILLYTFVFCCLSLLLSSPSHHSCVYLPKCS